MGRQWIERSLCPRMGLAHSTVAVDAPGTQEFRFVVRFLPFYIVLTRCDSHLAGPQLEQRSPRDGFRRLVRSNL